MQIPLYMNVLNIIFLYLNFFHICGGEYYSYTDTREAIYAPSFELYYKYLVEAILDPLEQQPCNIIYVPVLIQTVILQMNLLATTQTQL